jgi:hypothetical protein
MTVIARFEVIPIHDGSLSEDIAQAIEALEDYDISYRLTATDTVIEADDSHLDRNRRARNEPASRGPRSIGRERPRSRTREEHVACSSRQRSAGTRTRFFAGYRHRDYRIVRIDRLM